MDLMMLASRSSPTTPPSAPMIIYRHHDLMVEQEDAAHQADQADDTGGQDAELGDAAILHAAGVELPEGVRDTFRG